MKARELELCQIQQWYPRFRSVSLKTIIHALPETFVAYLQEDGLFLPRDSEALPARRTERGGATEYDDDYRRWSEDDDHTDEPKAPSFPQLEAEVAASIEKLGGSVFPKLNWSAPKDSGWITSSGSLRCTNFGEISLLLKASDTLVHDLCHAFDSCDDKVSHRPDHFFLALRKWYDLRPEMEFRGFVRHGLLVGICQREITGFYPALLESVETLELAIFRFFMDSLCEAFELEDYTFDCYVTRAGSVKLVDFNPWGAFTLPLLFTWDELDEIYTKFALALSEIGVGNANGGLLNLNDGAIHPTDAVINPIEVVSKSNEETHVLGHSGSLGSPSIKPHVKGRKLSNITLRELGSKAEFRIVKSNCHVQVNLRMCGGVPYDYVETGPGSAWDEFLQRAGEELQQQNRDASAGG